MNRRGENATLFEPSHRLQHTKNVRMACVRQRITDWHGCSQLISVISALVWCGVLVNHTLHQAFGDSVLSTSPQYDMHIMAMHMIVEPSAGGFKSIVDVDAERKRCQKGIQYLM